MGTILIEQAELLATASHRGQKRKYTGEDYIVHPAAVAKMVANVGGTEEQVAAAWLHDVVEDCGIKLPEIMNLFGGTVSAYVDFLTDTNSEGNRATRKARYANELAHAPAEVKTIKLADLIHNTESIVEHDPKFARTYLAEKRALLSVLQEGDFRLWQRANTQVVQGLLKLVQGASHE